MIGRMSRSFGAGLAVTKLPQTKTRRSFPFVPARSRSFRSRPDSHTRLNDEPQNRDWNSCQPAKYTPGGSSPASGSGLAQDGSWAEYRNVDFGAGANSVNVRVASAGTGGTLEFHLDSLAGPVIAQALIPVTGGWQTWTTVTASVSAAAGVRVLYVVVKHSGGTGGIGNLNWFQFLP